VILVLNNQKLQVKIKEGGYIEEVVSVDDQIDNDQPPGLCKVHENDAIEASEVRNPFIDVSISDSSGDLGQGKNFSSVSLTGSPPMSPSASAIENGTKIDMGEIDDEDDGIGMDNVVGDDNIPNPVHPQKSKTRTPNSQSRSFSLSWSWWARGGTRKLYTPLF